MTAASILLLIAVILIVMEAFNVPQGRTVNLFDLGCAFALASLIAPPLH